MTPVETETRATPKKGLPAWLVAALVGAIALVLVAMTPIKDPALQAVQSRAAIVVQTDFSQPVDGWFGGRAWSNAWSRERTAARIGQLALYRPSLAMSDYTFEFSGQLDRSLGWVFRASDLRNYYMARLIAGGRSAPLVLERSVVVAGEEAHRVQIPVRESFDIRRPVRIAVEVSGSDFRTLIDGRVVDFFHDDLLPSGGVGFTGQPDDRPRIYWMRVRYQDDLLGKVCAWLAPSA